MQWWNCHLATLRAPLPAAASPAAFGTWVRVMGYACEQECGGRLRGASLWTDRQWVAACNVTGDDVRQTGGLLEFDGDDLLVWGYPTQRQAGLEALRGEGAAGGSARTAAKAQAARQNGRQGGRPRSRDAETQQEPNGNPTKPNGNPTKPNGAESALGAFTSENRAETRPENPREWKDNGSVSVRVGFPAGSERGESGVTTTTRDFNLPAAHRSVVDEEEATWVERLRAAWPGVNLDRELRRAATYTQKARGPDAPLQRRFFEDEWLPRCADPVAPVRAGAAAASKPCEPAPEGWREAIADTAYGPGSDRAVAQWEELPPWARAWVREQTAKEAHG